MNSLLRSVVESEPKESSLIYMTAGFKAFKILTRLANVMRTPSGYVVGSDVHKNRDASPTPSKPPYGLHPPEDLSRCLRGLLHDRLRKQISYICCSRIDPYLFDGQTIHRSIARALKPPLHPLGHADRAGGYVGR